MSYPPPTPVSNNSGNSLHSETNGLHRNANTLTTNGANATPMPAQGIGMTLGGIPNTTAQIANKGFDIWGPLQRRKGIIILLCLIGAAVGYLNFTKTPKTYQSSLRLMITTQAPPSIVNGDLKLKSDSLTKHASLITSELVLNQAVESGALQRLPTFRGVGYPVGKLKQMVRVGSSGNNSETMTLSCSGSQPHDLPTILNQVVEAYRRNLADDSKAFGEESTDLIKELSEQLSNEKRKAEQRSLELYASLGVTTVTDGGQVLNPYNVTLAKLIAQRDQTQSDLRGLTDRLGLLEQSTASKDEDITKVIAIEAKKYLGLSRAEFLDRQRQQEEMLMPASSLPGVRSLRVLEDAQADLNRQLTQLKFDQAELSQVLGSGHRRSIALQKQIRFYRAELADVENELRLYQNDLQSRREEFASTIDPNAKELDFDAFRQKEDQQWIRMYRLSLQREIDQLELNLSALNEEVNSVSQKAEEIASSVNELNILQRQIAEKGEAVRAILDQLNEMNIMTKSYTMTKVKVLDEAVVGHVIAPSLPKSLAMGTMLAFAVGLGLAILIDQSELLFRSPYEIAELLNLPVMGRVPRINAKKITHTLGNMVPELIVAHKPGSTAAEAFRDIRTSLFFQANAEGLKTIQFTSPSPGDGKSTTVANLALSIAQAGKKVILVDADLRKPRVHQNFGKDISPGLTDVLEGEVELVDAIRSEATQPNMFLLTAGGRPKNPGEVVASQQFGEIIASLGEKFDFVLIDSPPVLPVSDPASIASYVDGVYMVTRIRKGVKVTMSKAKETLDRVNVRWLGVIINGLDQNPHYSEYGYQYGNYSYYGGRYGRYYEATNKQYRDKITAK